MTRHTYRRGEVVFYQGDPSGRLYVVEEGWVKLTRQSEAGDELLVDVFGPGSIFGEVSIFTNEPRSGTVSAIESVEMTSLSRDSFYRLVQSYPQIAVGCLEILAKRLRAADELVQDMSSSTCRLDWPSDSSSFRSSGAWKRRPALSSTCGLLRKSSQPSWTTRESINKTLALFRRQGIVSKQGSRLLVRDSERLAKRIY